MRWRLPPSVDERLDLIGQLWNSLEHEELPLTGAPQRGLDRRLAALDAQPADALELGGAARRSWAPVPLKVVFSASARDDVIEAQDCYTEGRAALGRRFRHALDRAAFGIAQNPSELRSCGGTASDALWCWIASRMASRGVCKSRRPARSAYAIE